MIFWILLLVFALVYVLTPWVIALSWRIGAVDVPGDPRRLHRKKIPRCGGIAVFLGVLAGAFLLGERSLYTERVLWGSALMLAVGLFDDIRCLRAGTKLCLQLAISLWTVMGCGAFSTYGEAAFAVFWLVLLSNAHNFIDGMDGLLAGCAGCEGLLLGGCLLLLGEGGLWQIAWILSAALLSFRLYNRYPAEIFAGDCGSGSVGFLLGALSLPLFSAPVFSFFNLSPLFLFAYPLCDLATSVLRRLLHGKSPFAADRAHLHHRLYAKGLEQADCSMLLTSVSIGLGGVGLFLCDRALWSCAAVASLGAVLLLIYLRKRLEV